MKRREGPEYWGNHIWCKCEPQGGLELDSGWVLVVTLCDWWIDSPEGGEEEDWQTVSCDKHFRVQNKYFWDSDKKVEVGDDYAMMIIKQTSPELIVCQYKRTVYFVDSSRCLWSVKWGCMDIVDGCNLYRYIFISVGNAILFQEGEEESAFPKWF